MLLYCTTQTYQASLFSLLRLSHLPYNSRVFMSAIPSVWCIYKPNTACRCLFEKTTNKAEQHRSTKNAFTTTTINHLKSREKPIWVFNSSPITIFLHIIYINTSFRFKKSCFTPYCTK